MRPLDALWCMLGVVVVPCLPTVECVLLPIAREPAATTLKIAFVKWRKKEPKKKTHKSSLHRQGGNELLAELPVLVLVAREGLL